jgi:hypothetical protein
MRRAVLFTLHLSFSVLCSIASTGMAVAPAPAHRNWTAVQQTVHDQLVTAALPVLSRIAGS